MSAIWGAIDFSGGKISAKEKEILRKAYESCVIDRYEEKTFDNGYMGCGIQYFTDEAVYEELPVLGEYYMTADVVLDNREELARAVGIPWNTKLPDGTLLYQVYRREGNKALNQLLGSYCFVWYDREHNKVELVADAVGNRCLYYYRNRNVLYFSTLLEPLAELSGRRPNDRWLVDFLAMDHLFMINEAEETPFAEIYRLAPAQYLEVTEGQLRKEQYWNPHTLPKHPEKYSDEEYKRQFRKLWDNVVKSNIRTSGKVSIMLSGGLDSTSVAAVAAPYLKKQGRTLTAYTAIPDCNYTPDNSGYYTEDESEDVRKTAEYYGNIETVSVDLDGKNAWDLHKVEMEGLEMPYKSVQNVLWLAESMRKAYADGSRLMLNGSYGNTSISYTDLTDYMNVLFQKRKFLTLAREVQNFSGSMGFDRKYAWKQILKENCGHKDKKNYMHPYRNSFVDRKYADLLGADQRIGKITEDSQNIEGMKTGYRMDVFEILPLRQIGEIATKHTLMTGVQLRDPTKDKRILEFVAGLPIEQFCKEGTDRRLVKIYLADLLPGHVMRFSKKGKQSADVQFRIARDWDRVRQEWLELLEKHPESRYVDTGYAKKLLSQQSDIRKYSDYDVTRYIYTLMLLEYEAQNFRR